MPANSRGQQLIELKDTITNLNKLIATLHQTLEESNKREKVLREQIEYLNKKLFGHSSELMRLASSKYESTYGGDDNE